MLKTTHNKRETQQQQPVRLNREQVQNQEVMEEAKLEAGPQPRGSNRKTYHCAKCGGKALNLLSNPPAVIFTCALVTDHLIDLEPLCGQEVAHVAR